MDQKDTEIVKIPLPTIRRLPAYLQILRMEQDAGKQWTSTTAFAEALHLKAIQVRKDMGSAGCIGKPKLGFHTDESILILEKILGMGASDEAVLIGVGDLGSALLKYRGFPKAGMRISAAFDNDPNLIGTQINGIRIQSTKALSNYIIRTAVQCAVLTVPAPAAQPMADILVEAGILGIWNFSSAYLRVPEHVVVRREDLAVQLASLSAEIRFRQHRKNS